MYAFRKVRQVVPTCARKPQPPETDAPSSAEYESTHHRKSCKTVVAPSSERGEHNDRGTDDNDAEAVLEALCEAEDVDEEEGGEEDEEEEKEDGMEALFLLLPPPPPPPFPPDGILNMMTGI